MNRKLTLMSLQCYNTLDHDAPSCTMLVQRESSAMTAKSKLKLKPIAPGKVKRVGANLESELYNDILEFAIRMDVDLTWVVRQAFTEFTSNNREKLNNNPRQLALELGLKNS